jgi:pyruvate ferredoxin oxidoreductase gamma subunit
MSETLYEIRLMGRGGGGIVTAGDLLGQAALREGRFAQSMPTFGPERRGALSACTLRIGAEEILLKCSTAQPSILAVLDPTIWHHAPVTLGLKEGATLLFNTRMTPEEVEADLRAARYGYPLPVQTCTVITVDATKIALEHLGRAITNTTMMGALSGATDIVSMASIEAVLEERFGDRAADNIAAAHAGRDGLVYAGAGV